jgi:hypothetical protein
MARLLVVFAVVSGASFLVYGYRTLVEESPRLDFDRYRMPRARRFVGAMQLFGGAGVLIGLGFAPLGAAAATGLALMMFLGLIVRFRIHDAPRLMVPAASLGLMNAALVALFLAR